jgi:hypothetical protein
MTNEKQKKNTKDFLKESKKIPQKNNSPRSWLILILLSLSIASLIPFYLKDRSIYTEKKVAINTLEKNYLS